MCVPPTLLNLLHEEIRILARLWTVSDSFHLFSETNKVSETFYWQFRVYSNWPVVGIPVIAREKSSHSDSLKIT